MGDPFGKRLHHGLAHGEVTAGRGHSHLAVEVGWERHVHPALRLVGRVGLLLYRWCHLVRIAGCLLEVHEVHVYYNEPMNHTTDHDRFEMPDGIVTGRYQTWQPGDGVPVRTTVGYPRSGGDRDSRREA